MLNFPALRFAIFIIAAWFFFSGLYFSGVFLIPVAFAAVFGMLIVPLAGKMENKGLPRSLSSLVSTLIVFVCFGAFAWVILEQIEDFSKDLPQMTSRVKNIMREGQTWITQRLNISKQRQEEIISAQFSSFFESAGSVARKIFRKSFNVSSDLFLMFIYMFCLLYYRMKFKHFILMIVPDTKQEEAKAIISNTSKVARQYLVGRLLLILFLAIFYAAGLSLVGLKNAVFISILAALVTLIPFIGNIIGFFFAAAMSLLSAGGLTEIIGIIAVFTVGQLIENYILEPLVVGKRVDLNPFFVIAVVVLGGIIWGVAGMVLSIPILGVCKIFFDNVTSLKPYGYLIGDEESKFESKVEGKIKALFKKDKK